jgi:transcriptional regulator with XRE-family HTH domain
MRTKPDHAFPALPALPLALAVERMLDPVQTREDACQAFGISAKTLSEWLRGKRLTAEFNTADRVLCSIELNWWEVWTAENTRPVEMLERVERAFTGSDTDPLPFDEDEPPLPLSYRAALSRAVVLRDRNPSVFTYPTIAEIMAVYHGFDRHERWWRRELRRHGVEQRPVGAPFGEMAVA